MVDASGSIAISPSFFLRMPNDKKAPNTSRCSIVTNLAGYVVVKITIGRSSSYNDS